MTIKPEKPKPVLKKYRVSYVAIVWATDEEAACMNMLDADDYDTEAEEITDEVQG